MQRLIYKIFFLTILFLEVFSFSEAKEVEGKTIYSFSQNWLRYDKYYEAYLPLKEEELRNAKSIHQSIRIEKYINYDLSFVATKGLTLFVNNKLVYKKISKEEETIQLPLKSFQYDKRGEVIITFYHSKGILPIYTAAIINKNAVRSNKTEDSSHFLQLRDINNR